MPFVIQLPIIWVKGMIICKGEREIKNIKLKINLTLKADIKSILLNF